MNEAGEAYRLREIMDAYVAALRNRMSLEVTECYVSIAPAYIEGQQRTVLQVSLGAGFTTGGGDGYQEGGGLVRDFKVTITVWRRMKIDRHGASEHVLISEAENMIDIFDQIRDIFSMTVLGGLVDEPVHYDSETTTSWYDADKGILRRDITFSNVFALELPRTASLTGGEITGSELN